MPSITVKNISDELLERVRQMAAAHRRSVNSEIIVCLERAVGVRRVDVAATLWEARSIRESTADYVIDDETFDALKDQGRP